MHQQNLTDSTLLQHLHPLFLHLMSDFIIQFNLEVFPEQIIQLDLQWSHDGGNQTIYIIYGVHDTLKDSTGELDLQEARDLF